MHYSQYTEWEFFQCASRDEVDIIECFCQVDRYLCRHIMDSVSIVVKPELLKYFEHLNCDGGLGFHVSKDLLPPHIDVMVRVVSRDFFQDK